MNDLSKLLIVLCASLIGAYGCTQIQERVVYVDTGTGADAGAGDTSAGEDTGADDTGGGAEDTVTPPRTDTSPVDGGGQPDTTPVDGGGGSDTGGSDTTVSDTSSPDTTDDTGGGEDTADDTGTTGRVEGLVINEVAPAGLPADWFEIYNGSDTRVNLSSWFFTDDVANEPLRSNFPLDTIVEAGGYIVIEFTTEFPGFGLAAAEELGVFDPDGELVDAVTWEEGDAIEGTSWGRIPDGTGAFETMHTPTPGERNQPDIVEEECGNGFLDFEETCDGALVDGWTCQDFGMRGGEMGCSSDCMSLDITGCTTPPTPIVINEVTSSDDDRIELVNVTDSAVSLDGWSLSDENIEDLGRRYRFPSDMEIGARERLVLRKAVHHTFGLGGSDAVVLIGPDREERDRVRWASDLAIVSYCRIPDATGPFTSCSVATFGEVNAE